MTHWKSQLHIAWHALKIRAIFRHIFCDRCWNVVSSATRPAVAPSDNSANSRRSRSRSSASCSSSSSAIHRPQTIDYCVNDVTKRKTELIKLYITKSLLVPTFWLWLMMRQLTSCLHRRSKWSSTNITANIQALSSTRRVDKIEAARPRRQQRYASLPCVDELVTSCTLICFRKASEIYYQILYR